MVGGDILQAVRLTIEWLWFYALETARVIVALTQRLCAFSLRIINNSGHVLTPVTIYPLPFQHHRA